MNELCSPTATQQHPCYVHVTGRRVGRVADFVEFEFLVGDTDLSMEMLLPTDAFEEFCRRHGAQELPAQRRREIEAQRHQWLYGTSETGNRP